MNKTELKKELKYNLRFIPDKAYIKLYYFVNLGKRINLNKPKTFNEKLNWLKFNDRNPNYTVIVDKLKNRNYIKGKIGEKYLVPLIGSWEKYQDINFDMLPDKFVLKCNHDSGSTVICTSKNKLDKKKTKKIITKSLKRNFYYIGREWQYKNIKPMVLCEDLIGDGMVPPDDYKFFCFNGVPKFVMVCQGRETGIPKYYFFDMDWNLQRFNQWGMKVKSEDIVSKPEKFNEMVDIARKLSEGFIFSRIDLYYVNNLIYFSEITLCPNSGFDSNLFKEADFLLGEMINLYGNLK